MKALGLIFSARQKGNCLDSVKYVLDKLKEAEFQTEIINCYDYEIKPCSHCNYECFSYELTGKQEKCPIQDDVPKIYEKMKQADVIVISVPTYAGNVSGLYKAWMERGLHKGHRGYKEIRENMLDKIFGLIVIGNIPAGGDLTYHTVILNHKNLKYPPTSILLQPAEYSQVSIHGTLIEDEKVRDRLNNMANVLLKICKMKQKRYNMKVH
jgi:multimeric flavodoxin WrbA